MESMRTMNMTESLAVAELIKGELSENGTAMCEDEEMARYISEKLNGKLRGPITKFNVRAIRRATNIRAFRRRATNVSILQNAVEDLQKRVEALEQGA